MPLSFTALLMTAASSFFSRSVFVFCYDEAPPSPWQPAHDFYHIDLGELGVHHGGGGGYATKVPLPRDVMVDVVNELGIKLLAIHNEHNDNNIAISPYGALSVLAALTEGLQGDAAHEIVHAAHIPKDKHVTRVGLRDIHRHLKSYFIPEEGFLAGLTLNLNNVTLRDEYEDVLRFYGFDYSSFNNALYPEPPTTKKPSSETSTLGVTFGMPDGTTTDGTTGRMENATTVLIDTRFNGIDGGTTEGISGKEITTTQLITTKGKAEPAITSTQTSETTKMIETTTPTTQSSTETSVTTKIIETTTPTTQPSTETSETTKMIETTTPTTQPSTTTSSTTTTEKETTVQPGTTSFYKITTTQDEETTYVEILETSDTVADKPTETTKNDDVTTPKEVSTTVKEETTTSVSSESPTESVIITTKISKVTIKPTDLTTLTLPESTTRTMLLETTATITTETSVATTIPAETTTQQISQAATETTFITTLKIPEDSTLASATTTDVATANEPSITTTTESLTTMASETTTNILPTTLPTQDNTVITQQDGDSQRTTREISNTMMVSDNLLITVPLSEASEPQALITVPTLLTTIPSEEATILGDTITTQFAEELPTMPFIVDETTVPINNPVEPFVDTDVQNDISSPAVSTPPEFFDQRQMDIETTTPFGFDTTPEYQDMTTFDQNNFDYNYNYDANIPLNGTVDQVPPVYDDNMANQVNNNLMLNKPESASLNRNLRRRTRSVVDYVIARFYDDHHPYIAPAPHHIPQRPVAYLPHAEPLPRPLYIPQQEPLTFAVYGKYRESGINFMKYDTVLPFYYAANLNALALSFPLDSTKYYLLLLLPVDDNGVDQLICDLRLYGNLRHIIEHLRPTHVVATIPSFKLKGYVTLTPLLQRLGIRKIFEPRQADFSPMTNVTDIYVTNIEQAVTVTIRNYLDPSAQHYKNFRQYQPVQFKADHPFLYFVIDSELNIVLMEGKVINPLNSRIS